MMRARRLRAGNADAELEMLQTDIMRFMAIIALCLLAIFAMVQSLGEVETPSPAVPVIPSPAPVVAAAKAPLPAAIPLVQAVQKPLPQSAPRPAAPTRPAPEPEPATPPEPAVSASPEGFSLRFADDAAFLALLRQGKLALQVQRPDQSWHWQGGRFSEGVITGDFYQLEPATVPLSLRQQFTPLAPAAGNQWLVSLPAHTRGQVASMMEQYRGGTLLIDKQGNVSRTN